MSLRPLPPGNNLSALVLEGTYCRSAREGVVICQGYLGDILGLFSGRLLVPTLFPHLLSVPDKYSTSHSPQGT